MSSAAPIAIACVLWLAPTLLSNTATGSSRVERVASSPAPAPLRFSKEGVYSKSQARRGLDLYMRVCSSCHGESFRGGEGSPPLKGSAFLSRWSARSLHELIEKVRLMPPNDPGTMRPDENADLVAAVLAANGFPAGAGDLSADPSSLKQIQLGAVDAR